jgi:Tol biopolymer transport system component
VSLLAGDTLGPYEIVEPIGHGGMGEVYRARDPRLRRDVAIKVSTARFSQRFEREARAIAALNHPNVCTLFDVGPDYLVMELVEGVTLADSLISSPLAQHEALTIARQIAEALEAAHEHGIVHRDLKPANVKIRPDGMVKVLDFGLAKQANSYDVDETPTIAATVTHVGTIVGTAAYMSPEQATGHAADRRADIWAFGVVLYEMLTGRRPFGGDTASAIVANVIAGAPDLAALPADVRGVVEKCLRKDPRTRWQWIGDVRLALDEMSSMAAPERPARSRVSWALASLAILFAVGFAIMAALYASRAEAPRLTTRFTVPIPGDDPEAARFELSPNGRLLAITAIEKGRRGLWVRPLDSLEARLLAGTYGAEWPFWSADSTQIGFFASGRLMRVPVTGGTPVLVAQIGSLFRGASWNADDAIVFSSSSVAGAAYAMSRVRGTGGTITPIRFEGLDNGALPRFLPDGRRFLFRANRPKETESGILVGSLDDSRVQLLVGAEFSNAAYVPGPDRRGPGRLLSTRARSLISRPFDARTLRVDSEPSTVVELLAGETGRRDFSVSDDGDLAYRPATLFQLTWVSRSGVALGEVGPQGIEWSPGGVLGTARLSPDETKVAYAREHDEKGRGNSEVWQLDLLRNVSERLTFFPGPDLVPVWSPNSAEIVFASNRDEATGFDPYIVSPGSKERPLAKVPGNGWPLDWSRDGRVVLLLQGDSLWTVNADGTAPARILETAAGFARISPDGRRLAYISSGSGPTDVYVRPLTVSGSATRVSGGGGTEPQWRRDGRELFYVAGDGMLMAVPVTIDGVVGRPAPLFASANGYQAAGDGQRFLVPRRSASAGAAITIVLNSR